MDKKKIAFVKTVSPLKSSSPFGAKQRAKAFVAPTLSQKEPSFFRTGTPKKKTFAPFVAQGEPFFVAGSSPLEPFSQADVSSDPFLATFSGSQPFSSGVASAQAGAFQKQPQSFVQPKLTVQPPIEEQLAELLKTAGRNEGLLRNFLKETIPTMAQKLQVTKVLLAPNSEGFQRLSLVVAENMAFDWAEANCERGIAPYFIASRKDVTPQECEFWLWLKRREQRRFEEQVSRPVTAVAKADTEALKEAKEKTKERINELASSSATRPIAVFIELLAGMVDKQLPLPFIRRPYSPYLFYVRFNWPSAIERSYQRISEMVRNKSINPPILSTYDPLSKRGKKGIIGYISDRGIPIAPGQWTGLLNVLIFNYISGFWLEQFDPEAIAKADRKRVIFPSKTIPDITRHRRYNKRGELIDEES